MTVRLATPSNPNHPRKGQVGTVAEARWFEPVYRQDRGRQTLLVPGCWLVWVRFGEAVPAWPGSRWRIKEIRGLFGEELEIAG